jgi:hypothetical protein
MVRLSVETINDAYQYINAVKQRELSLRDLQIPAIENLGATKVKLFELNTTHSSRLGPVRRY